MLGSVARRIGLFCWALCVLLVVSLLALGASTAPGARPAGICGQLRACAEALPARDRHRDGEPQLLHGRPLLPIPERPRPPVRTGDELRCDHAPEPPEHIALTSGSTRGITDDCTSCSVGSSSIFEQVGPTGWWAYEESMPSAGFTGGGSDEYAKKHNPAAYYTRIAGAYTRNAIPLGSASAGALLSDLNRNKLRRYSFVTPNLCNDEHDCDVGTGDAWLRMWVRKIVQSSAYRKGGTALFATYDEGGGSGQRVYTVVVSPYTKPGTVSSRRFTHYSQLKTTENMLGLRCLVAACQAGSTRRAFGL
jgi:Phosphoesterase family